MLRIRRGRGEASFAIFYQHFSGEGISERLCRVVYNYLQELTMRDFPVLPTDDLFEVYRIGDSMCADIDDVIEDVCEKLSVAVPSDEEVRAVITELGGVGRVENLVRMFARLLERQSA